MLAKGYPKQFSIRLSQLGVVFCIIDRHAVTLYQFITPTSPKSCATWSIEKDPGLSPLDVAFIGELCNSFCLHRRDAAIR